MWALNSFFERFVLSFSLKIERFVSDSAEIWICGLYICEKRLAFLILPIWLINNISQIQYIYYRILIDLNLYDNFFSYDYTK